MNWNNVKTIFLREVRDQLRDRRTVFMIAVLPVVLYPLLGMSMSQVLQFVSEQTTRILVVGAWRLPASPALFEDGHIADQWFKGPAHVPNDVTDRRGPTRPLSSHVLDVEFLPEDDTIDATDEQVAHWRQAIDQGQYEAVLYFPRDFSAQLQKLQAAMRTARPADVEVRCGGASSFAGDLFQHRH